MSMWLGKASWKADAKCDGPAAPKVGAGSKRSVAKVEDDNINNNQPPKINSESLLKNNRDTPSVF